MLIRDGELRCIKDGMEVGDMGSYRGDIRRYREDMEVAAWMASGPTLTRTPTLTPTPTPPYPYP